MTKTFQIDESNPGAKKLLEYLRSLNFVKEIDSQEYSLTKEHLNILQDRESKYLLGKKPTHTFDEVAEFARKSKNEN